MSEKVDLAKLSKLSLEERMLFVQKNRDELAALFAGLPLKKLESIFPGLRAVIHDLKGPTGMVEAVIEQALENDFGSDQVKEVLSSVLECVRSLHSKLAETLENLTGVDDQPQKIGIQALFAGAMKKISCADLGVKLEESIDPASVELPVETFQKRVIYCLISNSMRAFGNVSDGREKKIIISSKNENGFVAISLKDNACGMPKDFDPFEEGVSKNESNGLGLFEAKKFVEGVCGGKMWHESEEEVGTTFFIQLSRAKPEKSEN